MVAAETAPLEYNRDIRPILSENCFYCHGPDANKREAKLRLDIRDEALKQKAFIPGDAAGSELVKRLFSKDEDEVMPPPEAHRTVTAAQKETLKRWIAAGAPYEEHWAFVAPRRAPLPTVGERHPIDTFVTERLKQAGLTLSAEAPREILLRRLALDLTGLPPTPEETATFVADRSPDAYEKQVDRLLASPHYGERMILPWLDASRYADSNGFQQDGDTFQWVWRDWLVRNLNADKPFDQLSTEMLAGDLIPNATLDQKIATAFNRNHILNGEGGNIAEEQRYVSLFDRVDTVSTTWLGLTLACAQCHDHKYDPLTQKDYYSLLDAFNHAPERGVPGGGPSRFRLDQPLLEVPTPEQVIQLAKLEADYETKNKESAALQAKAYETWLALPLEKKGVLDDKLKALLAPGAKPTAAQQKTLVAHYNKNVFPDDRKKSPAFKAIDDAKTAATKFKSSEDYARVMIMSDATARVTNILDRGAYLSKKEKVTFNTPAFLPKLPANAPANRLGLAQWLFTPNHPLTARVQVNRLWETVFGVGIVRSSEEFGSQGDLPVHPELLDWLAGEFVRSGWDTKHMLKLMFTSRAYQQSSASSATLNERDPDNRLLARGPRFRPSGELLRDQALAVSGLLSVKMYGPPVRPMRPASGLSAAFGGSNDWTTSPGEDARRRSVYTDTRRNSPYPSFTTFDAPNRETCTLRRGRSNTPLQAFVTLNDPVFVEASQGLARRLLKEGPKDTAGRLQLAYRLCVARGADAQEVKALETLLQRSLTAYRADPALATKMATQPIGAADKGADVAELAAWTAVASVVMNLDEFLMRR